MAEKTENGKQENEKEAYIPFPKIVIIYTAVTSVEALYFGMRSPLFTKFFIDLFKTTPRTLLVSNHAPAILQVFSLVLAPMLADSYLGYYKQSLICMCIWLPFMVIVPLASVNPTDVAFYVVVFSFTITPMLYNFVTVCATPLIGDQFMLPQQSKQLTKYFFVSYWLYNIGLAIGNFLGPYLRSNLSCFGRQDCYFIPMMGVFIGTGTTIATLVIFTKMFIKTAPEKKNVVITIVKLTTHAIKVKRKSEEKKNHILDYADDKYDKSLIEDVKRLQILKLMLPQIFVRMCIAQEYTSWVLQANYMDGNVKGYVIEPDHVILCNTILCAILIPLFTYVIVPFTETNKLLKSKLRHIGFGMTCYFLAWLYCACLCLFIEKNQIHVPLKGEAQVRIYNNMNSSLEIQSEIIENIEIKSFEVYSNYKIKIEENTAEFKIEFSIGDKKKGKGTITLKQQNIVGYVIMENGVLKELNEVLFANEQSRQPRVRTLGNLENTDIVYRLSKFDTTVKKTDYIDLIQGSYSIVINTEEISEVQFKLGGLYTVFIYINSDGQYEAHIFEVFYGNNIHISWMFPQYLISVIGEITFTVATTDIIYTQSPITMKSCASAFIHLIAILANTLVGLFSAIINFQLLSSRMFFFDAMIGAGILIHIYLAIKYKNVEDKNKRSEVADQ